MRFDSEYRMAIGGSLVRGAATLPVEDPATGNVFAEAPDAPPDDLNQAVAAARHAFPNWSARSWEERGELLVRLAEAVLDHTDEFATLLTREQGKPVAEAAREVRGLAGWLTATAAMRLPPQVHEDGPDRYCETRHVPIGVVGAITPWNYPLLLAAFKIAPALVTGNTLILKPSPFTPLTTLKLGELARTILPSGVFNVVTGGDALGPALTGHPGIDKIAFTGSTETGRKVMRSAADGLKRLTLELGGNDAGIVMPDADAEALTETLFQASFGNAGQVCLATKRLYVHADIYEEVRDALVVHAATIKVGPGSDPDTKMGPLANRQQYDKVVDLIEDCRSHGYRFACGGEVPEGAGWFIPPTIVDDPPDDARVVQEEQFGPILPLMRYEDDADVVARANAGPYALAASIWTADPQAGWTLGRRLEVGNVWINESRPLAPHVPFAGHGQSGFGVENGVDGLLEYTLPRTASWKRMG